MNYVKKYLRTPTYGVARNLCRSLFLWIVDFLCFCWELIFAIFRKYTVPGIDNIFCIFVLSENVQQKYIFSNIKKQYFIAFFLYCFVSE